MADYNFFHDLNSYSTSAEGDSYEFPSLNQHEQAFGQAGEFLADCQWGIVPQQEPMPGSYNNLGQAGQSLTDYWNMFQYDLPGLATNPSPMGGFGKRRCNLFVDSCLTHAVSGLVDETTSSIDRFYGYGKPSNSTPSCPTVGQQPQPEIVGFPDPETFVSDRTTTGAPTTVRFARGSSNAHQWEDTRSVEPSRSTFGEVSARSRSSFHCLVDDFP